MDAAKIAQRQFHQFWSPVLMIFRLFGFNTYTEPACTRYHRFKRLLTNLGVICLMLIFSVYTLLMKLSFHIISHVNVMSDQFIYLTVLPAHLISLFESLSKHRQTEHLFDRVLTIVARLRNAHDEHIIDMVAIKRKILLKNWMQIGGLIAVMAVGIWLTGIQSWIYYRWIILAQFMSGVRLMEVTMHIELLSSMMGALESLLLNNVDNKVNTRLTRLNHVTEIYGHIHRHAGAISAAYSWSVLSILLYALNATINTSFWLVFMTFNNQTYK